MRIGATGSLPPVLPLRPADAATPAAPGASFGEMVTHAVEQVNQLQGSADDMAQKLASGEAGDIHQVLLALDRASTALGATVQIRNKAIESYQEIMRMQV